ncbi:MAG: glycoside hydrolase family 3 C-terminal domain-containing protein [Acidobacteria bacterium]|nr:glycoside hydrolase family 3 C-terminal domain-containing protein [Acidobacteriota bacterium]MBS1864911.1 glycoside hydrolase family 3 C-terminal domain-containing protein [Acidobacteriota bacterium]
MTLDEKVGQLVQYSAGQPTGPGTGRTDYADMLARGEVGALFNIVTAKETNQFQRIAVEKSRLHIPVIFGLDVIHGFRTEFPIPLGISATWDPLLAERAARVAAREASAAGIRWTFSPMVDIARDPRWGRIAEGNGEDTFLDSAFARAYVRGYQGNHLNNAESILACVKHYVGYGAAEAGREYNSTEISEHSLREYYLPPFRAAIDAGAGSLMTAFNSLNGIPASANPFTVRKILKQEWGFRGIVDSDWTSVAELMNHGIANDGATAAKKAFLAGVDMDMVSSLYHDHLAKLVQSGEVPQADLDDAVRRVLRVKFALGLFENPYAGENREKSAMLLPESVELSREVAERSFVLLKNDLLPSASPLLPLPGDVKSVALIGPLADDAQNMLGSWGAQSRPEDVVTLRKALVEKLGESRVRYAKGGDISAATDAQIKAAVDVARNSDVVILALGESGPQMTGEAASRAHLDLPGRQQQLLESVVAAGKPVALILFSGRSLTLPWAFEHVPAVLAAWFPGDQAGPALVRTLFGDNNPGGKLSITWPRSVGQIPIYYNALNTGRPARQSDALFTNGGDQKFVSRYLDESNLPQFPFGFGLSYSSLRYGPTELGKQELRLDWLREGLQDTSSSAPAPLQVSANISNTGLYPVTETAQLYIRLEGTSVAMPVRMLKGFQKIAIAPGETKRVVFAVPAEAFAFWNDQNRFAIEPARVTIWISGDSASGTGAAIEIRDKTN